MAHIRLGDVLVGFSHFVSDQWYNVIDRVAYIIAA